MPFGKSRKAQQRTFQPVIESPGNRTKIIDRNGRVRLFQYDFLDRLTKEIWKADTTTATLNQISIKYDLASQTTSIVDSFSSATFQYDYAGQ